MNKKGLFAICLIILLSFDVIPVRAQETDSAAEIKKVINDFLGCTPLRSLECLMAQVSPDYYDKFGGEEIDYAKFKSYQEAMIENSSKKYIDIAFSDIGIFNLVIQDDKASLDLKFTEKTYNVDSFKTETTTKKISVALEKKEGVWKITKFRRVSLYD